LLAALAAIHVQKLIRGHSITPEGVTDCFGDGSCITVHTAIREQEGCVACISSKQFQVERISTAEVCKTVEQLLMNSFETAPVRVAPKCVWCRKALPLWIEKRVRYATRREVLLWLAQYAQHYLHQDEKFEEAWEGEAEPPVIDARAYELFPVIYDLYGLSCGAKNGSYTYRLFVMEPEKQFMLKICPGARGFNQRESLDEDEDPRLFDIQQQRRRHGKFKRGLRELPPWSDEDETDPSSTRQSYGT
uniref:UCH domain-containing protein n=1 Tax=Gongylonema pulchrum TaxID=637853 RepID=A0A183CZS4_9BILA